MKQDDAMKSAVESNSALHAFVALLVLCVPLCVNQLEKDSNHGLIAGDRLYQHAPLNKYVVGIPEIRKHAVRASLPLCSFLVFSSTPSLTQIVQCTDVLGFLGYARYNKYENAREYPSSFPLLA